MANSLPPPPINDPMGSFVWLEWYRQLRNYVSQSGSVPWGVIDFNGSDIRDIALRSHNNMQTLQGGTTSQYFHITNDQHNAISNSLDVAETGASVALPTTPTILKLPSIAISNGIGYDTTTGVVTFVNGGVYTLDLLLNINAAGTGKSIYFYVDIDTGTGYNIRRYSARTQEVVSTITQQTFFASTNYFSKGTKLRIYLWGSASGMTMKSVDIPGTTAGTVTVSAARLLWTGSL